MTIQEKMHASLVKAGIPYKEIHCYGSQIVITSWSRDAADRWANLLTRFSTVRGIIPSVDYAKENKNTVLRPSTIKVWRTFACIQ